MELEKQAEVLNDLVLINNDRVEGYRKAMEELKDEDNDLKLLFQKNVEQSRKYHTELVEVLARLGKSIETGTKTSGKIYRAWMDVKAFFGGSDRKVVLDNCEDGEDHALRAYEEALSSDDLTPDQRNLLIRQQAELKIVHDEVKALRDVL